MDENVTTLDSLARDYLQTLPTAVVAAAVRGDLDVAQLLRAELAARGLDEDGRWIGFTEAKRLHLGPSA